MPLIAYPNRGDTWEPAARLWVANDGERYDPTVVATWSGLGATWLGGCCGTSPADIAELARSIAG